MRATILFALLLMQACGGLLFQPAGVAPTEITTISMSLEMQSSAMEDPLSGYLALYAHDGHQSLRLADGRIILIGGQIDGGDLDDANPADIYDPSTDRWSSGGASGDLSVGYARMYFASNILQDGRVMLVGGHSSNSPTGISDTEFYDPASNSWSLGPSMNIRRYEPASITLADGRVLVVGGTLMTGNSKLVEIFDPDTNIWNLGPASAIVRWAPNMVTLADGRVLIYGGERLCADSPSAEIFDPTNNTITPISAPNLRKVSGNAVLLSDDRIFVAGGYYYKFNPADSLCYYTTHDRAEIYNVTNNSWTLTSQAPESLLSQPMILPNGKIFVLGVTGVLLYDLSNDSWTLTAFPTAGFRRTDATVTQAADGNIIYLGGYAMGAGVRHRAAHIYNAQDNTWGLSEHRPEVLVRARRYHETIELSDGRILAVGGQSDALETGLSSDLFDPASGTWSRAGDVSSPRRNFGILKLQNGKILIAGGQGTDSWNQLNSAEIFDPATEQWTAAASLGTARNLGAFAVLGNGKVIATGGYDNTYAIVNTTEIYDPGLNAWSAGPAMPGKRAEHRAFQVSPTMTVLIGGVDENWDPYNKASVYNGNTNSWSESGPMIESRYDAPAVMLADGRILVAGGVDSNYNALIDSAEIFDPESFSWIPAAPLPVARIFFKMVLLSDGKVVAIGGYTGVDWDLSNRIDLYDPAANTWTYLGEMATGREGHSVNRLGDGRLFIHGGIGPRGLILHTSEFFGFPSINILSLLVLSDAGDIELIKGSGTLNGVTGTFVPDSSSPDGLEFLVTTTAGTEKILKVSPE